MPKAARPAEKVAEIRACILDYALEIIAEGGFDSLTMRSLANKFGFAAKTLYNYFTCKEEIYLMVLTRGFELLNAKMEESLGNLKDPVEKLRTLCRIYVDFGINNPNYYNIMFNWAVPKYHDYINTAMEPTARTERETAFRLADNAGKVLKEISRANKGFPRGDAGYLILKLWTNLHGVVSLYNSRGMHEYESDPLPVVKRLTEDALAPFLPSS
jgi:AcrR family transcriptional regulator